MQKYVPENRVHYCPNGILNIEEAASNGKAVNNKSTPEILFLSHLFESKGVLILADALKILKEKGITFHCTMIGGEGDLTEDQMRNKIEESGLTDYIDLVGKKYGEEKQTAFSPIFSCIQHLTTAFHWFCLKPCSILYLLYQHLKGQYLI